MLKIFNSLTRQIEDFEPLDPSEVGMYICGPTVYNYMHIGNLRTFIFSDILRRALELNGYQIKVVRNITDIDDKIVKAAKEKNETIDVLTKEYINAFFKDLDELNVLSVNVNPKATEHIGHMVKYIEELISKGLGYIEQDGSVYFDISKFPDYGKLSQIDKRQLLTGTRILSDEYSKDNVQDFALWKAVNPDEIGWDSPWGRGRPGWHIECSVMSQEYLGQTFDIHTGGIDLLFPHHENEIAQSEGKTAHKFVNYFVHGEHMLVDGQKMSKSLNNFYTLKDIKEKGFDPLALRYLFLTAHYRDKLNFTWESLSGAQNALNNLKGIIRGWYEDSGLLEQSNLDSNPFWQRFVEAAKNDLNMPQAVGALWDMVHSSEPISMKAKTILEMDKILGLGLDKYLGKQLEVPAEVIKLVNTRETVRKSGDFTESDKLRGQISKLGYEVEDTASGPVVKKLNL
ncbi:MAG: cysteine--tRNA ligase [Candidatus Daviesbacteria bacterium]|nr:cysteine--tRNA ligase [Candidatus Daviesbacteria bacterium]